MTWNEISNKASDAFNTGRNEAKIESGKKSVKIIKNGGSYEILDKGTSQGKFPTLKQTARKVLTLLAGE